MVSLRCVAPVKLSKFDSAQQAVLKRAPQIVRGVFRSEKKSLPAEVGVVFVGRSSMRRLHKKFMNDPSDTDVLSFPTDDGGDIVICAPVAAANAFRFEEPVARELLRLIIHGALHLLGYKDEPQREQKKMWKKQERLVEKFW